MRVSESARRAGALLLTLARCPVFPFPVDKLCSDEFDLVRLKVLGGLCRFPVCPLLFLALLIAPGDRHEAAYAPRVAGHSAVSAPPQDPPTDGRVHHETKAPA